MMVSETSITGVCVIELERQTDERGFFSRAWCAEEFEAHRLRAGFVQANISLSKKKGTLRGLHYQIKPREEVKLIRCTKGAIYDVALDLRPTSPTYRQWAAVELSAENYKMLYVPEGCAHGYLTLIDDTEVFYPATQCYASEYERGVRFDDPAFEIKWPINVEIISKKDKAWPWYVE